MVKQERAARTRQALIQAAAEVFAEEGFVTASLSTISKRAGVSNGALHFHFANKGMLADAVEAEAAKAVRLITEAARAWQGDSLQAVVDATHELMRSLAHDTVVRGGFELAGDSTRRGSRPCGRSGSTGSRTASAVPSATGLWRKGCPGRTAPASSSPRPRASRSSAAMTTPGCRGRTSPASGRCSCHGSPAGRTWTGW